MKLARCVRSSERIRFALTSADPARKRGASECSAVAITAIRRSAPARRGGCALLPYADWWTGYLPRLNDEIGPNNWSIDLQPWGEHQIIARLTAFGGLIQKASSGSAKGETNGAAEAEAQAKKRVCAEGVLLGQFFYFLPSVWASGERVGKDFYFNAGEEQRAVYEMYRRAGLAIIHSPGITIPPDTRRERDRTIARPAQPAAPSRAQPPTRARDSAPTPAHSLPPLRSVPAPLARRFGAPSSAWALLQSGPRPAADRHDHHQRPAPALASDKQLDLIITLVSRLRSHTAPARSTPLARRCRFRPCLRYTTVRRSGNPYPS